MSPKLLIVLTVLAVLLGGLALALVGREARSSEPLELGLLHPELAERVNDAVEVEVTSPEGRYTLRLAQGRWVLVEKGGYPVKVEDIRRTLWALTALEKRERMTDEPARYDRLGVQDVEAEGSTGKRIVLRDAAGKELAALIVGQTRGTGRGLSSFFARVPSERHAWLVEGELPLPSDADSWLDRQPIKIERKTVQAVETRHPDGELVRISRPAAAQDTFDVHGIPEGHELRYATVASGMGTALEYLSFQDVAPAADFDPGEDEPVETSMWTFDGLRVDARVFSKGEDEHWVAFDVAYDPEVRRAQGEDEIGPPPPDGEDAAPPDGEDAAPPDGEDAAPPDGEDAADPARAEAVRERALELQARLSGWVYQIAPYNRGNLAKRMEDLTQPIAPSDPYASSEWDVDLDVAPAHDHDHPDEGDPGDPRDEHGHDQDRGQDPDEGHDDAEPDEPQDEEPPDAPPDGGEDPEEGARDDGLRR